VVQFGEKDVVRHNLVQQNNFAPMKSMMGTHPARRGGMLENGKKAGTSAKESGKRNKIKKNAARMILKPPAERFRLARASPLESVFAPRAKRQWDSRGAGVTVCLVSGRGRSARF